MPWASPAGGGNSAVNLGFIARRTIFVDAGGDNNDAATSWDFQGFSPWNSARNETIVRATVNRVGFMNDLRGKVTPFVFPDAAFGFTAGTVRQAFRSRFNNDLWVLVLAGPTGNEIGRSQDNGVTWTLVNTGVGIGGQAVENLAQAPNGRLWTRESAGPTVDTFFSDDFGANWTQVVPDPQSVGTTEGLQISPDGNTVFVLGDGTLFSSAPNAGAAPVFVTTNLPAPINVEQIAFKPDQSIAMLFARESNFGFTTDNFLSFTSIPNSINPLMRGGNAAGNTLINTLSVFYSDFYDGFIAFSTGTASQSAAFFPADDMLNPVSIPYDLTGLLQNTGVVDQNGYCLWLSTTDNQAFCTMLPSLAAL